MFQFTHHQGNAHRNDTSPHTCQDGCHPEDHKEQVLLSVRTGSLVHHWKGREMVHPPWTTAWRLLRSWRDPAVPLLYFSKGNGSRTSRRRCPPTFTSVSQQLQRGRDPQGHTSGWGTSVVQTHGGLSLGLKREGDPTPAPPWMNLETSCSVIVTEGQKLIALTQGP